MKAKISLLILASFVLSLNADDIEISNIYAKPTPPNIKNTAIFLDIKNSSDKDIKLIKVSSSSAQSSELHTHKHIDEMMKMVKIDEILIPAKSHISLSPGGPHIMLINVKKPINEGDSVDATFEFDNGQNLLLKDIIAKKIKQTHDHEHKEHKH